MSNTLGLLNEADIRELTLLIDSLEHSTFDFLQFEVGDLKVTISKGDAPLPSDAPNSALKFVPSASPPIGIPASSYSSTTEVSRVVYPASNGATSQDNVFEITAPFLGIFYAQSEPGAPPFVSVGSEVREDTTVALIEVMKTFNAIPAGRCGTITEICVQNTDMVEFAQVLFRVRPA